MRWLYISGFLSILSTFIADIWLPVDYELGANLSLIYLAILVSAFTIIYGAWANWKSNRVGKVFFIKSIFLSLVLIQIVLSVWWPGDYPFRQQIRFALYTAGVVTYASMLVQLVMSLRETREQKRIEDAQQQPPTEL
jgi:TRAP-type C4-dicarboxylate transport system permease small subunit